MRIKNLNFKDAIFYNEEGDWDDINDYVDKERDDVSNVIYDLEDDELDDGFYDDGKTY